MVEYLAISNLEKYQHYKERNPPWIKIHAKIFRDYEFSCLSDASKLQLILMWVLASQCENKIPYNAIWIKQQIGVQGDIDLETLIEQGFIYVLTDASKVQANASNLHTNADSETETYKQETETNLSEKKQIKKPKEKKYDETDLAFAQKMATDLSSWSGSFKTPSVESWADEIRRFRQGEKTTIELIQQTWTAIQADSPIQHNGSKWKGWRSVVLSPQKFRKQYHQVRVKLNLDNANTKPTLDNGKTKFVSA